jgi:hypothetical protein
VVFQVCCVCRKQHDQPSAHFFPLGLDYSLTYWRHVEHGYQEGS